MHFFGAGNESRTRHLHLGKVALYRMSYARRYPVEKRGGDSGRSCTTDTRIFSPLLYLLSYRGIFKAVLPLNPKSKPNEVVLILRRKKETTDMELSPLRRKRNGVGFF